MEESVEEVVEVGVVGVVGGYLSVYVYFVGSRMVCGLGTRCISQLRFSINE